MRSSIAQAARSACRWGISRDSRSILAADVLESGTVVALPQHQSLASLLTFERRYDTRAEASMPGLPVSGTRPRVAEQASPAAVLLGEHGERLLEERGGDGSDATAVGQAVAAAIDLSSRSGAGAGPTPAEKFEDALEDLGSSLQRGDFAAASDLLGRELGITARPILTQLRELHAQKQAETQRRQRRRREEGSQTALSLQRVRTVDALNRAYATGKRKSAIARVWLSEPPQPRAGLGRVLVNGRSAVDYFPQLLARMEVFAPFEATSTLGRFDALRHGIAKALQCWDPELRQPLRAYGYLTRDSRVVERKKPGKAKARKSFQWVKR